MSTTTAPDWATKATRDQGLDCLKLAQTALARAQQEIEYLLEVYDNAESDSDRARTLNRSIEFLLPFLANNLRVDLLAQRQADLLVLAKTEKPA
jgi:hypothetical protein